jgi:hypothetical protein
MDDLIFCISQNMQYYYEKAFGVNVLNWQLFLVMNPIGFNYNGFSKESYEILNGINADSDIFITRAEKVFGFSRVPFNGSVDDPRVWEVPHIIMVDDYYMSYHPSYQKNHYERFVISQSRASDHVVVFDMESHTISIEELKQAAGRIFTLTLPDMSILGQINSMLTDEYSNKEFLLTKSSLKGMDLFLEDFRENKNIWGAKEFDLLFFFVNKLGGPTAIRRATGLALDSLIQSGGAGDRFNDLKEKAQLLGNIAKEWDIVGSLFFKVAKFNRNNVLERIEERLQNIIEMEKNL